MVNKFCVRDCKVEHNNIASECHLEETNQVKARLRPAANQKILHTYYVKCSTH